MLNLVHSLTGTANQPNLVHSLTGTANQPNLVHSLTGTANQPNLFGSIIGKWDVDHDLMKLRGCFKHSLIEGNGSHIFKNYL